MRGDIDRIRKDSPIDVSGIGSALLDFTVDIDDGTLDSIGLIKGSMQLIDEARSGEIQSFIKGLHVSVSPGGSAANTVAGVTRFGGTALFQGKVGEDEHGSVYIEETERLGIIARIARDTSLTGHAITFITPDSERTFATHLGAALRFTSGDIDREGLSQSKILHLEGYLFEPPALREACFTAMEAALSAGVIVSLDLSDPELIKRIHDTFETVVREFASVVFVNEEEALAFTGRQGEEALGVLARFASCAVVKLGATGSLVQAGSRVYRIPAFRTEVVNTNGAGDMYASGVLYGMSRGVGPEACGRYGSYAASLVVAQVGARYPGIITPA
ncbi:MAG: adenosine kinase [Spirochaetes bacterium]|nr:adenosine kinase [Spirochaetota bacterium]